MIIFWNQNKKQTAQGQSEWKGMKKNTFCSRMILTRTAAAAAKIRIYCITILPYTYTFVLNEIVQVRPSIEQIGHNSLRYKYKDTEEFICGKYDLHTLNIFSCAGCGGRRYQLAECKLGHLPPRGNMELTDAKPQRKGTCCNKSQCRKV